VLDALQLKLDKVELILNGVQQKAAATTSKVLICQQLLTISPDRE
jgi:hypothetical protein